MISISIKEIKQIMEDALFCLWDTSYGIYIGLTPPWRFWDTMQ